MIAIKWPIPNVNQAGTAYSIMKKLGRCPSCASQNLSVIEPINYGRGVQFGCDACEKVFEADMDGRIEEVGDA